MAFGMRLFSLKGITWITVLKMDVRIHSMFGINKIKVLVSMHRFLHPIGSISVLLYVGVIREPGWSYQCFHESYLLSGLRQCIMRQGLLNVAWFIIYSCVE